ncbi:hypothetical protein CE91St46_22210 [Eubacteriales bacterium]|nr:hypothetical protein CE91St46_22210 [Eubacteriales bacterium]
MRAKKVTVVKMHNKICKIMVKNEFNINYRKIRKAMSQQTVDK